MPRTEGRLKSLFWPSLQTGSDVDYLRRQGHWVCTAAAVLTFVFSVVSGHPILAILNLLFYYLGGVGVRERSRYAASAVRVLFVADTPGAGLRVVRLMVGALLLSNFRATWTTSHWRPESEEAILPPRLSEIWGDTVFRYVARMALAEGAHCLLRVLRISLAAYCCRAGRNDSPSRRLKQRSSDPDSGQNPTITSRHPSSLTRSLPNDATAKYRPIRGGPTRDRAFWSRL